MSAERRQTEVIYLQSWSQMSAPGLQPEITPSDPTAGGLLLVLEGRVRDFPSIEV